MNEFISSGEIDELNDIIPHIENDYDSDNSFGDRENKRKRFDRGFDHNAQLVYDKDSSNQAAFIPPLMALNVHVDSNGSDQDFRNSIKNNGDRDDRDVWQSNSTHPIQWAGSSNPFTPNNSKPPSLLNISIQPPDMSPTNNKWDSNTRARTDNFKSRSRDDKNRRRDSDGRRISRFDSNGNTDSRNRRSSGVDGNSSSGRTSISGSTGNGSNSSSSRHRSARSKRRN